MNRFKALLFTAVFLCSNAIFAETVVINGITYDVATKAKVATVIQSETGYNGDIVIPATIEHNGVTCNVTTIGGSAFYGCYGLTSIVIPNSVTSIGDYAFKGCSGLTSIEIPNSVTSIGDYAFYCCYNLTSVTIGNGVTSIGRLAFDDCSGLTSIEIPNSVTNIGGSAFAGCSGLTSVVIPNSVTSIGDYAFSGCYGLTSVVIPNSVTSIGDYTFYNCSGLTNIEIPNSITIIGSHAFGNCSSLTSVVIPNSVTSIGDYTFYNCSGLTNIEIPNSITIIGSHAFSSCSGLTSVTIGKGIEYIYGDAFAKCSNLTDVYCLATTVPETRTDAFNESYPEYMTLHVPAEAINYYKTTEPWSSFGTIVTLDGTEVETPVCATPVITYNNGKVSIECETEGAEFVTSVTCDYINTYYTSSFELAATYNISVYAMAAGHDNSETVNATLCWIDNGNSEEEDNTTDVINIPATAVLVTSVGGTITIVCEMNGEKVEIYTTDGVMTGSAIIDNGTAKVNTGLEKGSVAIVNIAGKSIKVIVG